MGKFLTVKMFEDWRNEQRASLNPPSNGTPPAPRSFVSSMGARGHCPDCKEWGDWADSACPHCGLTISKIVERARAKAQEEIKQISAEVDPDLSWPGDGTRWDHI